MKKLLPLCLLIILAAACTDNKSVIEELTVDDTASLVDDDTLYQYIIPEVDAKRKAMEGDLVLQSRYKDLSIGEYYDFKKTFLDSDLLSKLRNESLKIYYKNLEPILAKHKTEIDSLLEHYEAIYSKFNPANYVKVEFISKGPSPTFHYIRYTFKITPLRGTLEKGSFTYSLHSKKNPEDYLCKERDLHFSPSSPTSEPFTFSEDYFYYAADGNYGNIKEGGTDVFDFEYSVKSARVDGKTYTYANLLQRIPKEFFVCMDEEIGDITDGEIGDITDGEIDYIITNRYLVLDAKYYIILSAFYGEKTSSPEEEFVKLIDEKKKENNKLAYEYEKIKL